MFWKRWMLLNFVIVAAALVIGAFCLRTTSDYGLYDLKTVEAYLERASELPVGNVLDHADSALQLQAEDIRQAVDRLYNYAESVRTAGDEVQIMIVEATADLAMCSDAACAQRVIIKDVISGEAIAGESAEVFRMGGIRIIDGQLRFTGFIPYSTNMMLPGYQYLVVCKTVDEADALKNYGTDYWKFEVFPVGYSVVCLTDCENVFLSEDDVQVNWRNNEFLAYHQETVDSMLRLKEAILEQYGIAR